MKDNQSIIEINEVPTLTDGEKRLIAEGIAALQAQLNALPVCWHLAVCHVRSEGVRWQDATPVNLVFQG